MKKCSKKETMQFVNWLVFCHTAPLDWYHTVCCGFFMPFLIGTTKFALQVADGGASSHIHTHTRFPNTQLTTPCFLPSSLPSIHPSIHSLFLSFIFISFLPSFPSYRPTYLPSAQNTPTSHTGARVLRGPHAGLAWRPLLRRALPAGICVRLRLHDTQGDHVLAMGHPPQTTRRVWHPHIPALNKMASSSQTARHVWQLQMRKKTKNQRGLI